jgi:hypothetical protein
MTVIVIQNLLRMIFSDNRDKNMMILINIFGITVLVLCLMSIYCFKRFFNTINFLTQLFYFCSLGYTSSLGEKEVYS